MKPLFLLLLLVLPVGAADPKPFAERIGPAIGAPVPAFEAKDQNGKVQTIESLRGTKGLFLLFIRSADW
jgi:hypothetical protein